MNWTQETETAIKHRICRLEERDRIAPVDPFIDKDHICSFLFHNIFKESLFFNEKITLESHSCLLIWIS